MILGMIGLRGFGFRVWDRSAFRVMMSFGFGIRDYGAWGLGFRILGWGLGFRILR